MKCEQRVHGVQATRVKEHLLDLLVVNLLIHPALSQAHTEGGRQGREAVEAGREGRQWRQAGKHAGDGHRMRHSPSMLARNLGTALQTVAVQEDPNPLTGAAGTPHRTVQRPLPVHTSRDGTGPSDAHQIRG